MARAVLLLTVGANRIHSQGSHDWMLNLPFEADATSIRIMVDRLEELDRLKPYFDSGNPPCEWCIRDPKLAIPLEGDYLRLNRSLIQPEEAVALLDARESATRQVQLLTLALVIRQCSHLPYLD